MTNWIDIQNAIDRGRAVAGRVLGPTCDVFRLTNASTADYLDITNRIATNINVRFKGAVAKDVRTGLESDSRLGTFWFEMLIDMAGFQVGDIFVVKDPVYGAGQSTVPFATNEYRAICLAEHAPVQPTFGARLNTTINIFRLPCDATCDGYAASGTDDGSPLLMAKGVFLEGAQGATPANVPAGLMATGRTYGEKTFSDIPADMHKSAWYCYVPPLQGFRFRENDRIIAADGGVYRVLIPYYQDVGACGSQLYLERESAGTASS